MMLSVSIRRCGAFARQVLRGEGKLRVAAVFERCFYVEAAGRFVGIGGEAIGDGPLNAVMADGDFAALAGRVAVGQVLTIARGRIEGLECSINFSDAVKWAPPPWPCVAARDVLRETLQAVRRTAATDAPHDGLARLVMGIGGRAEGIDAALVRIATPRLDALRHWLGLALVGLAGEAPPVDLIGLGPGLTPSGDDVLSGVLLALAAISEDDVRARLGAAALLAAGEATSPVSAALLGAAVGGIGSAALHRFIGAVVGEGRAEAIVAEGRALGAVGHTSGWDAMAGVVLGLECWVMTAVQRPAASGPT